jgi:hypothetical protein
MKLSDAPQNFLPIDSERNHAGIAVVAFDVIFVGLRQWMPGSLISFGECLVR